MQVTVLGSGSSGNGYVINTNGEYLLLECGVHPKEMLKAINFETAKVSGCLCSHAHNDHARYIRDYQKYGFPVIMTERSKTDDITDVLHKNEARRLGNYIIVSVKVPHNETECDGFYIRHKDFGNLLFITDAEMCPLNMSMANVNHLMVECNYSVDYVWHDDANTDHVYLGHMELQTCKKFIHTIYGDNLKSIGLIHLSKANADPDRFRREMQDEFPQAFVWIARKGIQVELGGV